MPAEGWTTYFWVIFALLALVCASIQIYLRRREAKVAFTPPPEFVKFKKGYLLVYFLVFCTYSRSLQGQRLFVPVLDLTVALASVRLFEPNFATVNAFRAWQVADWLQGPYIYALYQGIGFKKSEIALLFLTGYASSAIFGTFVGSLADKYGRRRLALTFCVLYTLACVATLFKGFWILFMGRVVSGIATSLLFSVFEAWLVNEHNTRGFSPEQLSHIFSISNFGNGMVAILAGIIASFAAAQFGNTAPYIISGVFLILAFIVIFATWNENYGNSDMLFSKIFSGAFKAMRSDFTIPLLGLVQSLFEASMYVFVFGWTPVLQSYIEHDVFDSISLSLEGLVFSCFMVCIMLGSGLFQVLVSFFRPEDIYKATVGAASLSFFLATLPNAYTTLLAFVLFEICCGIHFPCMGTLRSKYIPEESRSAVMNFFRIPLNLLVIGILNWINSFEWTTIFVICGIWLMLACCLQIALGWIKKKDLVVSGDSDWQV